MVELGSHLMANNNSDNCQPPAKIDWNLLDLVLKNFLAPYYELLCHNEVETSEAVDEFVSILSEQLRDNTSINTATSTVKNSTYHRPRAIDKLRVNLTREKNLARMSFADNPGRFLQLVRSHNKLIQVSRTVSHAKSTMKQELAFRRNPWQFAKSVCQESNNTFTADEAYIYFGNAFSDTQITYSHIPDWVINHTPDTDQDDFESIILPTSGVARKI